jgi:glutathionyl-hydroquinone reductase
LLAVPDPVMAEAGGWRFAQVGEKDAPAQCLPEPLFGCSTMRDLYAKADPEYSGQASVPLLWDSCTNSAVNNESAELIKMLSTEFDGFAKFPNAVRDLYPAGRCDEIDAVGDSFLAPLNSGVYKAGFATTQDAYDEAVAGVFDALDVLERRLAGSRYLCGDALTLADVRLFPTLIRFDAVYVTHYKTNLRTIRGDYPVLSRYTREIYQMDEVRPTVEFFHIKHFYFRSQPSINPHRVVPAGPDLSYLDVPLDTAPRS